MCVVSEKLIMGWARWAGPVSKMIEQNNLVEEKDIESFGRDIYILVLEE